LTDDSNNLRKWQFPAVTLQPDQYLLVRASDRDRANPITPLHTNFKLANEGEYLGLVHPDGVTVEFAYAPQYPAQATDVSYGLSPNGQERGYFSTPTPGSANGLPIPDSSRAVVISELMYSLPHPTILDAEDTSLEFIELHNRGLSAVDVTGWKFTRGIDFTLPAASIPAGGQLVVAADPVAFAAAHPQVRNYVGGWTGTLSNSGETLELVDQTGAVVDDLRYADEGDWSTRSEGPNDRGYRGWIWQAAHSGGGHSLELINLNMTNDNGQNWTSSAAPGGTPDRPNSVASNNIAPLIADVIHDPPLPHVTQSVHVTARLSDEAASGLRAALWWRVAGAGNFVSVDMADDGQHGDGVAGDGVYGAMLPPQPNLTVVEYYVQANDSSFRSRTWPAPTAAGQQQTNAIYQVFDAFDADAPWQPGSPPIYHVIMTPAERAEFEDLYRREPLSDAQYNATFVAITGTDIDVRYNTGVRIRGSGSRTDPIPNNRINIPSDRPWQGVTRINVNQRSPLNQIAGSALFRLAGVPVADVHAVRMYSNGVDLKNGGIYAQSENLDSEFTENHFAADPDGNLYRGRRPDESPPGGQGAGLVYLGPDPPPYVSYTKSTNASQADWSDVIDLTYRLNITPDDQYVDAVREVVDVTQWLRTLATNSLIGNGEASLLTGDRAGDDYAMYRGLDDTRFKMIPYDWDTLFTGVNDALFEASNVVPLNKLVMHPEFLPEYYAQCLDVIDNVLLTSDTNAALDAALQYVASPGQIESMKQFLVNRANYVRGQINQQLTATTSLTTVGGVPRSTVATPVVTGTYPQADTRAVRVRDQLAALDGRGNWNSSSSPGLSEPLLGLGSNWRYLDNGSNQGTAWRAAAFDDSGWQSGPGQLGYGDGDEATVIDGGPDPNNHYVTSYFRTRFQVDDPSRFTGLVVRMVYDDGAAVYLNGTQVLRADLADGAAYNTVATTSRGQGVENNVETFVLPPSALSLLVPGQNVLAVEVHQGAVNSPDVSFDLALDAAVPSGEGFQLTPGMNRIPVRAYDNRQGAGTPLAETSIDIYYDDGNEVLVTGTLAGATTWKAAQGPYRVRGNVVVPETAVLTIEPGTTVFFEQSARLTVNGQLVAVGSSDAPIWFTRLPGENSWNGLQFVSSPRDNRLEHVIIEYGITNDGLIGVDGSNLTLDHVRLDHTDRRRIRSIDSSLVVRNSTFTNIFEPGQAPTTDNLSEHIWGRGIPAGGQWIVQGNTFGTITGHNDAIDFDAPRGAGRYAQILDNRFLGGGDDALDMTGDVLVQGNVFRNYIRDRFNTDPGQSNTVSASGGDFWLIRNVFDNVQHASLIKEGAFSHFLNNTIISSEFAPLYFDLPGQTSGPGRGAVVEGSIFLQPGPTFDQIQPDTDLQVNFSFLPSVDEEQVSGLLNRFGDAHVAGADGNFQLLPGSPAQNTGPRGIDMGAAIPAGAIFVGLPAPLTNQTTAQVFVGGPGLTDYRYQLDNGPVSTPRPITQPIQLANLTTGNHRLRAWGLDFLGNWQVDPTVSPSWQVAPNVASTVRINEVLAHNVAAYNHAGQFSDAVELYNYGGAPLNLGGYSLSDRTDQLRRFVIPAGTTLGSGQYLVLHADNLSNLPGLHLGFGLDRQGDALYLFSPAGSLLDSVTFGNQLPDLSLGRYGHDGQWTLTQPTLAGPNLPAPLGDPSLLKINEWYASGDIRLTQDMVELFNPQAYPVHLGGLSLTDEPFAFPAMSVLPDLSFIAGQGYLPLVADGDLQDGPDHLSFNLSATHEHLALFDASGQRIDQVFYYDQTNDVSQGRVPDGAPNYAFRRLPTFGVSNGGDTSGTITVLQTDWSDEWKYNASGQDLGTAWRQPNYDDSQWQAGPGLLGNEDEPLPQPMRTQFPIGDITYYFRQTVQLDEIPEHLTFTLFSIIDDGVIVYVNGQEVLRLGMPNGDIDFQTLANRGVDEGELEGPFAIPNNVWALGENVIAAEVHQSASNSRDLTFGLQFAATKPFTNPGENAALQLLDHLRITELMYHPRTADQPEYVELQNTDDQPMDLSGVRLNGGIDFTFPAGTQLPPKQFVVITENAQAFRQAYGPGVRLAGEYTGKLSNGGEELALLLAAPLETAVLRFEYAASWYPATNGQGSSLSIVDPQLDFRLWNRAANWQATTPSPGRGTGQTLPGDLNRDGLVNAADIDRLCLAIQRGEAGFDLNGDQQLDERDLDYLVKNLLQTTFGDANLDGIFNSADLVQILAAGEYEDNVPDNSTWAEGDWNCDGDFTTQDLVLALQEGGYVAAAGPAAVHGLSPSADIAAAVAASANAGDPRQDDH
jgi:hypothetical protein